MTTTVKVTAHCGEGVEVHVEMTDEFGRIDGQSSVIQDGESVEKHVYDSRSVTVREVPK